MSGNRERLFLDAFNIHPPARVVVWKLLYCTIFRKYKIYNTGCYCNKHWIYWQLRYLTSKFDITNTIDTEMFRYYSNNTISSINSFNLTDDFRDKQYPDYRYKSETNVIQLYYIPIPLAFARNFVRVKLLFEFKKK